MRPSGELDISARAWVSTIGSLSTYTTRDSGATAWASSCTFGEVGMPVPMSRNCRTPCFSARWRTTRSMKVRVVRIEVGRAYQACTEACAATRSGAKLVLPPMR